MQPSKVLDAGVAESFVADLSVSSGVPGTGKTATVYEVVRSLREEWKEEEIPQVPPVPHCRFGRYGLA